MALERDMSEPASGIHVLLVDDEEDWLEIYAGALIRQGYQIEQVNNRREAVRRLRSRRFELVIVNLLLRTAFSGAWLADCTLILDEAAAQNSKVIVVTGAHERGTKAMNTLFELQSKYEQIVCILPKRDLPTYKLREVVQHVLVDVKMGRAQADGANPEKAQAVGKIHPGPALVPDSALPPAAQYITWLHLSDLHFEATEKRKYEIQEVVKALIADLAKLRNQSPSLKPDLVFFTGDLANKGKRDEFTQAFDLCFSPILEACGIGKEKLFLVPGNHDVDRNMTTDELDAGFLQRIKKASDVQALLNDSTRAGYLQQLTQRMDSFGSALETWENLPFSPRKLSWGHAFSKSTEYQIGVIGLNSVYTSASFKDLDDEIAEQGRLFVGKPLFELALRQIPNPHPKVCVALLHHPLDWLCNWDKTDIENATKDACRFILHGHSHRTQLTFLGADQRTMQISAGALFKDMKDNEAEACLHAYNIMCLDLANQKGTLHLRRYDPANKRYGADDTSEELAPKGEYAFHWDDRRFYGDTAL